MQLPLHPCHIFLKRPCQATNLNASWREVGPTQLSRKQRFGQAALRFPIQMFATMRPAQTQPICPVLSHSVKPVNRKPAAASEAQTARNLTRSQLMIPACLLIADPGNIDSGSAALHPRRGLCCAATPKSWQVIHAKHSVVIQKESLGKSHEL